MLPFDLKRLKALLREREVGVLTVKKRGSAVEPEELRRRVKPQGPHAATVFLTRVAGAPRCCWAARPGSGCPAAADSGVGPARRSAAADGYRATSWLIDTPGSSVRARRRAPGRCRRGGTVAGVAARPRHLELHPAPATG